MTDTRLVCMRLSEPGGSLEGSVVLTCSNCNEDVTAARASLKQAGKGAIIICVQCFIESQRTNNKEIMLILPSPQAIEEHAKTKKYEN